MTKVVSLPKGRWFSEFTKWVAQEKLRRAPYLPARQQRRTRPSGKVKPSPFPINFGIGYSRRKTRAALR